MKGGKKTAPVLICCSVLQAEVESLRRSHWPDLKMRVHDSMLHMRPDRLAECLEASTERELAGGSQVVLVYGECCTAVTSLERRSGVVRTSGRNCYELLLGWPEYLRFCRDGAYFLLPEWTKRWRQVFAVELGLNAENASALMGDLHRKLVYLDTGLAPACETERAECSRYCGLPCEVRQVKLDHLRDSIDPRLSGIRGAARRSRILRHDGGHAEQRAQPGG
jgi:hypothetical protein